MACHVEINLRTGNPGGANEFRCRTENANRAGLRVENRQHQHGDEDEYDGRDGKIDRLGREAGRAVVVTHGPPSPVLVHFPSHFPSHLLPSYLPSAVPMAGSPPGYIEQVGKRPGAWPGPDLTEANGLLVLFVRLFVGGLLTARILTLLLRAGRIRVLRLRAARVLALLLRINWIGRLRGFVGALLRI